MSEKYRPTSGEEGAHFQDRFCDRCKRDAAFQADPDNADGCEILARTMLFDVDEPEYPVEWIRGDDGRAKCTAFEPEAECSC